MTDGEVVPHDGVRDRLTRRRALGRLGAGMAVAWTTPVLLTMHTGAAGTPVDPVVSDAFDRADTDAGLGLADTGQAWSGLWGISSGEAYYTLPGYGLATIDPGVASTFLVATVPVATEEFWLVFRLQDGSNYLRFGFWPVLPSTDFVNYQLVEVVGGIDGTRSLTSTPVADGDQIVLRLDPDNRIRACVNGSLVLDTSSTTLAGETGVGLAAVGSTVRFDDFAFYADATALPCPPP
jgi:hypothetical protein